MILEIEDIKYRPAPTHSNPCGHRDCSNVRLSYSDKRLEKSGKKDGTLTAKDGGMVSISMKATPGAPVPPLSMSHTSLNDQSIEGVVIRCKIFILSLYPCCCRSFLVEGACEHDTYSHIHLLPQ